MKYHHSRLDRKNLEWFKADMTRASLASIHLRRGNLRGLSECRIDIAYPISVIAGKNGSGKSTMLALAACAFHNRPDGFSLPGRKAPYYTMSDFFVQSEEEVHPDGINIGYQFYYNNWRPSARMKDGVGPAWQSRTKKKGGKWSNYSRRVDRNVVFSGIERVVPHSERSVSKSYRHYFKPAEDRGYEKEVCGIVGRILGKKYDQLWFREHSKYRLPHVKHRKTVYSGFNMGAGENALFEIISTILAAPDGLLLVIDEIELGLHESAQRRLVEELKELCHSRKIQIICTTHSPTVLKTTPPEGRFFLERHGNGTVALSGVSPAYAAGRLAEQNSRELDIFVEDGVAEQILKSVLSTEERRRVTLLPIGSANAVLRQLASRKAANPESACLGILDGDQRAVKSKLTRYFIGQSECSTDPEKTDAEMWLDQHLLFLPGDGWPELWMFSRIGENQIDGLAEALSVDVQELEDICEMAATAEKHRELSTLAESLCISVDEASSAVCRWIAETCASEFSEVSRSIGEMLE